MAKKRVLIVDDSRTAQARLRKLLADYDVEVDTANSAEDALDYLTTHLPAVLFMDHLMPGMDGFQALQAIKSNPDTAMVPIIMYTSKSGDVYVGQARALGAIDVLSKDVTGAGDLDKMLSALHIQRQHPAQESEALAQTTSTPNQTSAAVQEALSVEAKQAIHNEIISLKEHMLYLFQSRLQDLKEEFSEHYRHLVRQIQTGFQKQAHKPLDAISETAAVQFAIEQQTRSNRRMFLIVGLLVTLMSALMFYMLYDTRAQLALAKQNTDGMAEFVENQRAAPSSDQPGQNRASEDDSLNVNLETLVDTIAWAINLQGEYEFGTAAIGDKQFAMISDLVSRLSAADFEGLVSIEVHHGNFCVISNTAGGWELPAADKSFDECKLLDAQVQGAPTWSQYSRAFSNFISSSPMLQDGKIRINVEQHGISHPFYSYPSLPVRNAGEWNSIAAMNNRISIKITTDI